MKPLISFTLNFNGEIVSENYSGRHNLRLREYMIDAFSEVIDSSKESLTNLKFRAKEYLSKKH